MLTARRMAVLLLFASVFCLSNCRSSRLARDAHVLFDSPQVQRLVEQIIQEEQGRRPASAGPNYQRLADELRKEPGYDVWVFVSCRILFDGRPNYELPYWKVEFENGPVKGKVAWVPKEAIDDARNESF